MYPDGLCKLDDHTWSKCIEFEDVNYQLAKPDDQTAIFEALCDMYNAHDASIGMQLSLVSRRMNREDFDIPPSALEDETFAALITEAEKYIGYPYVWGGSNPNTSFDCSGFVSWVLTQSGVCNTGRLGAQGLYNISTPVSSANARPGDLIFFIGTYDTPGVSHVGIYVGGGKMLHCGDPIQYTDINTSYWQSHFYAFGRPPYN